MTSARLSPSRTPPRKLYRRQGPAPAEHKVQFRQGQARTDTGRRPFPQIRNPQGLQPGHAPPPLKICGKPMKSNVSARAQKANAASGSRQRPLQGLYQRKLPGIPNKKSGSPHVRRHKTSPCGKKSSFQEPPPSAGHPRPETKKPPRAGRRQNQ